MKRYNFRLNNVLRVRRVQEDIAKNELLAANNEVQNAIAHVEQRLENYTAAATPTGSTAVDAFMRSRYFNELAGKAVVAARAAQFAATSEAAIKRDAFGEAARKVKALDRLNERSREEYAAEMQRESDRELDEIANARFRRPLRTSIPGKNPQVPAAS